MSKSLMLSIELAEIVGGERHLLSAIDGGLPEIYLHRLPEWLAINAEVHGNMLMKHVGDATKNEGADLAAEETAIIDSAESEPKPVAW